MEVLWKQIPSDTSSRVTLTLVFFSTFIIGYYIQRYLRLRLKYKLAPGPFSLPIFGHLLFEGSEKHLYYDELSKKYGKIFSLYFGPHLTTVVTDYDLIKDLSSRDTLTGRPPKIFEIFPGHKSVGELNGADWKDQRRFLLNAFRDLGMGRTDGANNVNECVTKFLESLRPYVGTPIRLRDILKHETNNLIFKMITNTTFELGTKMSDIVNQFSKDFQGFMMETKKKYHYPFLEKYLDLFSTPFKAGRKSIDALRIEIEKQVSKHEKNYQEGENNDFIDYYLAEMKKNRYQSFTRETLLSNATMLIVAGAEATQITLEWVFTKLVIFPEVQEKVYREITRVVGKGRLPEWSDKNEMPYTQAVILEVFRHTNMIPINEPRWVLEDESIAGYDLPKGSSVIFSYWSVHTDPNIWGDPEEFRPERFMRKDGKHLDQKMTEHMMAFSLGKRNCPGEGIAMMNVFLYLSAVVQNFNVLPPKEGLNTNVIRQLGITLENATFVFTSRN